MEGECGCVAGDTVLLSASAALPLFRRSCCLGTSAVGCVASESMPSLPRRAFSVVLLFLLHNMNGGCDRGVKKTHTTREKLHCIVGLHLYRWAYGKLYHRCMHCMHSGVLSQPSCNLDTMPVAPRRMQYIVSFDISHRSCGSRDFITNIILIVLNRVVILS